MQWITMKYNHLITSESIRIGKIYLDKQRKQNYLVTNYRRKWQEVDVKNVGVEALHRKNMLRKD